MEDSVRDLAWSITFPGTYTQRQGNQTATQLQDDPFNCPLFGSLSGQSYCCAALPLGLLRDMLRAWTKNYSVTFLNSTQRRHRWLLVQSRLRYQGLIDFSSEHRYETLTLKITLEPPSRSLDCIDRSGFTLQITLYAPLPNFDIPAVPY